MGILQEAEKKPASLKEKLVNMKSVISRELSSIKDPDAEDRQDFQDAKLIAKEISGELRSNNPEQNFDRIEHVHVGKAHVIFSRNGIEKSEIEGR